LRKAAEPMVDLDKDGIAAENLNQFDELYRRYNGSAVRVILGPTWAQGSTDDYLVRVKRRADELGKIPIHMHTLQTPIQKAYGLRRYGKSLLAHLDDLGLVDENLTLGHAVYVSQDDIELLAGRGASITHHPSCNLAMRNGIAPVYYLHRAGVNVALGIDDKGINDDEDAIMELRMIHRLHRISGFDLGSTPPLSGSEVLRMGTVNAARVCGFQGEIGALLPGMKADMILLDLEEMMNDPYMSPVLPIEEVFIHRAKGSHVDTVIVGGQVVMENREIRTVDVAALYAEVRQQASRGITREQRELAETLQRIKPYYQKWYEGWTDYEYQPFYTLNSRN
jgi:5-methylthioadenosine/S-adenosylhomocysteine deaminase